MSFPTEKPKPKPQFLSRTSNPNDKIRKSHQIRASLIPAAMSSSQQRREHLGRRTSAFFHTATTSDTGPSVRLEGSWGKQHLLRRGRLRVAHCAHAFQRPFSEAAAVVTPFLEVADGPDGGDGPGGWSPGSGRWQLPWWQIRVAWSVGWRRLRWELGI
jgi:hypothetical protein